MINDLCSTFTRIDPEVVNNFVSGKKLVCAEATTTVMLCINEILRLLSPELKKLTNTDKEGHKRVFVLIVKIACCFDLLFGAMISDRKMPFYTKIESNELKEHLKIIDVKDVDEYWKEFYKGMQNAQKLIGVFSR